MHTTDVPLSADERLLAAFKHGHHLRVRSQTQEMAQSQSNQASLSLSIAARAWIRERDGKSLRCCGMRGRAPPLRQPPSTACSSGSHHEAAIPASA